MLWYTRTILYFSNICANDLQQVLRLIKEIENFASTEISAGISTDYIVVFGYVSGSLGVYPRMSLFLPEAVVYVL